MNRVDIKSLGEPFHLMAQKFQLNDRRYHMTHFTIYTQETAPAAPKPWLHKLRKAFGRVPGLYVVLALKVLVIKLTAPSRITDLPAKVTA